VPWLNDAEARSEQARKAGRAAHSTDSYIDRIVERAPTLTADQVERLRGLLPAVSEPGNGEAEATAETAS
jgi:hypothetical protein